MHLQYPEWLLTIISSPIADILLTPPSQSQHVSGQNPIASLCACRLKTVPLGNAGRHLRSLPQPSRRA